MSNVAQFKTFGHEPKVSPKRPAKYYKIKNLI